MRSVFTRLVRIWRRTPRLAATCYLRENGPLAYEFELFGASPRDRVETLFESGLTWAWKGGTREWTTLTRVSLSAFLADLPGGALMIGAADDLPAHLNDVIVKDWLHRFCRVEPSPLAAAAPLGSGRQLLFVPQQASPAVNALLAALGLDRRSAARGANARLGGDSLESAADRL